MTAPPAIIPLTGDWKEYLDDIYERFQADMIDTVRYMRGKPVKARFNPATDGKGFSFWHVISEGSTEEERTPDLRRCERINWIAWMLTRAAASDDQLMVWTNSRTSRRGTAQRLVLFCEANGYVVILEERKDYFLLVTAYPVHGRRAAKLKQEWNDSQK